LDSLTGVLKEVEARRGQRRVEMTRLRSEHEELEAQRRAMEARLEDESNKIRDSRMRMTRVRNERELLALKHEVNLAQEATGQCEEDLLGVMERIEEIDTSLVEAAAQLDAAETETQNGVAERDGETARLSDEIAAERVRRDELAVGLDAEIRQRYEQIFSHRGGVAVVPARDGTCQGCHMKVPPQLYIELQKFRDVRECPNCHRILYFAPPPES